MLCFNFSEEHEWATICLEPSHCTSHGTCSECELHSKGTLGCGSFAIRFLHPSSRSRERSKTELLQPGRTRKARVSLTHGPAPESQPGFHRRLFRRGSHCLGLLSVALSCFTWFGSSCRMAPCSGVNLLHRRMTARSYLDSLEPPTPPGLRFCNRGVQWSPRPFSFFCKQLLAAGQSPCLAERCRLIAEAGLDLCRTRDMHTSMIVRRLS